MSETQPQKSDDQAPPDTARTINVWATAGEVGFLIAIPLVVLVLLGIKIDRYFSTLPLFIICGMILSMVISTVAIARKIKQLNK